MLIGDILAWCESMDENIGDLNIAWSGLAGELILTSGSK